MELTEARVRYLLEMYRLALQKSDVSCQDIADALKLKKASVSRMTCVMMEQHLLVKERYSKIYLTDTGFVLAKRISEQVAKLMPVMAGALHLTDEQARMASVAAVCALLEANPDTIPLPVMD